MGLARKKRGRPRKKRSEDTPEYWEKQLHNHRLGEHRGESKREVLACFFVNKKDQTALEQIGTGESVTRQTDELASLHLEAAEKEEIVLSREWLHYLEYMDVIAAALSPKDKGAALKNLFLEDARSRYWEQPPEVRVPASLTPAELRRRWLEHEIEIRPLGSSRRNRFIRIVCYPVPPEESEDLDESGEPPGHWEGLKFIPPKAR